MAFDLDKYVPVHERLVKFWDEHPNGRIVTRIVEQDIFAGWVIVQAQAFRNVDDAEPSATGHAHEIQGEGMVNKTSFVENCETSAIGRALGNMGYEIMKGIASREEMEKVQRMTDNPPSSFKELDQPYVASPAVIPSTAAGAQNPHVAADAGAAVSQAQLGMMKNMARERELDLDLFVLEKCDCMPDELTKKSASMVIDAMKAKPQTMAAVAGGASSSDAITKNQLSAVAAIALQHGVNVVTFIQQDFPDLDDPEKLTKKQASTLIDTYGSKRQ